MRQLLPNQGIDMLWLQETDVHPDMIEKSDFQWLPLVSIVQSGRLLDLGIPWTARSLMVPAPLPACTLYSATDIDSMI